MRDPALAEVFSKMCHDAVFERAGVFSRRVFDMENGVGNRAVIELTQGLAEVGVRRIWIVRRKVAEQFQRPITDSPCSLARQVALIAEAQLENSDVVMRVNRSDGSHRTMPPQAGVFQSRNEARSRQ